MRRHGQTGATTDDILAVILARGLSQPTRPAVRASDRDLTYGELIASAQGLAGGLQRAGVARGDVVVITPEQGPDRVVQPLAALMCGAAYCPIDRDPPPSRIERLVAATEPTTVVAAQSVASDLGLSHLRVVDPSIDQPTEYRELEPIWDPYSPAYVLQTSGSQGEPKTVEVSRGALSLYVRALRDVVSIDNEDRYLQTASLTFSAAARQLWLPLSVGAELVVPKSYEVADPERLLDALEATAATVWDTIPAALRRACTALEARPRAEAMATVTSLRLVLSTGEPLPWSTIDQWRSAAGDGQQLVNLYSQTETAGTVCTYRIAPDETGDGYVPLGRAMDDVEIHLVDPVSGTSRGDDGEILVESDRLANGYLGEAHTANSRFIEIDGRHLYRTGDLASRDGRGVLRVAGRADSRLKVRGFRVDPVEVEAALERLPGISRAGVSSTGGTAGTDHLVAYLEVSAAEQPQPESIRTSLARDLPPFAIPTVYEVVQRLPTTHTGKLDRSELSDLDGDRLGHTSGSRQPSTPEERVVLKLIAETLSTAQVGLDDNFMDLGGHSLAAIDLSARIQEALGVSVGVAAIFDSPTAAEIADLVIQARGQAATPDIEQVDRSSPLAASPMQEALFILSQLHPDDPYNNINWAAEIRGPLDLDAAHKAFDRLCDRHEALRTRFDLRGSSLLQVLDPEAVPALEVIDLTDHPETERRNVSTSLAEERASKGFDSRTGPLWRAMLVRETADLHVLVIVAHHSITDMYSVAIMIRDLVALHDAVVRGTTPDLETVHAQLADFVAWQNAIAGSVAHAQLLEDRAGELAGAEPLELTGDLHPDGPGTHEVIQVTALVDENVTNRLRQYAHDRRITLFVATLAALKSTLHGRSGQSDILVGCPFARRDRVELRDTVGMLVNTLPIRTRIGQPDPDVVVAAVNRSTRAALAAVDVAYAELVDTIHDGKRPDVDMVEVLFQFQEDPLSGLDFGTHEVSRLSLDPGAGMFPLAISVQDRPDQLHVTMEMSTRHFSRVAATEFLDDYLDALRRLVE